MNLNDSDYGLLNKVNVQSVSAGKARRMDRKVKYYLLSLLILFVLVCTFPQLGWYFVAASVPVAAMGWRRMNEVERLEALASIRPSRSIRPTKPKM